jgi:O-antigen/teichoic acid export membrane protein
MSSAPSGQRRLFFGRSVVPARPSRITGRLRSGLIIAAGQAGIRSAVAIYALVLIRYLTPSGYGEFAFTVSVVSILLFVADGGFTRLLIRDVARSPGPVTHVVNQILVVRAVVVSVAVALTGLAALVGVLPVHGSLLPALLAALGFQALAVGFESAAIGMENTKRLAAGQYLEAVVLLTWLGALLAIGPTPSLAIAGMAAAAAIKLVFHTVIWIIRGAAPLALPSSVTAVRWTRQAGPFLLLGALGTIYYKFDIVILHTMRGSAATAPYAAAYRVVDASSVLGAILLAAISPHLSRLQQQGAHLVLDPWRRYVRRTAALLILPVAALAIAAEPIAGLLFGHRYMTSAGTNLRILAPSILFMVLHHINVAVMFADDDQRLNMVVSSFSVLGNVALTSSLVALNGANGAALASTLSEVVLFSGYAFWIRRRCTRARLAAQTAGYSADPTMLNRA